MKCEKAIGSRLAGCVFVLYVCGALAACQNNAATEGIACGTTTCAPGRVCCIDCDGQGQCHLPGVVCVGAACRLQSSDAGVGTDAYAADHVCCIDCDGEQTCGYPPFDCPGYACGPDEDRLLDGPMPAHELAYYQSCKNATECVAVRNGPSTGCDCVGPSTPDLVPINSSLHQAFSARFAFSNRGCNVQCATYEQRFWDSGYVLDCVSDRCEVVERHDASGRTCRDGFDDCPEGYSCETNDAGKPEMACLFTQ